MLMLRGIRFVFSWGRGVEGLGLGDADIMMMAGAFVGWQPVLMAFFVAVGPALVFAAVQLVRHGEQALPFGPSLAAGVFLTVLFWPNLGRPMYVVYSEPVFLLILAGVAAVLLLVLSVVMRLVRGVPADPAGAG
jgi:leader peptidase (prepilin peptidase)/N-methyltransferase